MTNHPNLQKSDCKPATKGNRSWKLRKRHGRKPIFGEPEALWQAACEYFEWVDANPLYEMQVYYHQGKIIEHKLPKMRPMTLKGLCLFLRITYQTWCSYRQREGFHEVTSIIEDVIYEQKFAGAVAGLLNPNLIARELGLKK